MVPGKGEFCLITLLIMSKVPLRPAITKVVYAPTIDKSGNKIRDMVRSADPAG